MIVQDNQKKFEQPDAGLFLGTVIDIVDLGPITGPFGTKNKVRIVWVLDKNDSEGKPFGVIGTYNAHMNEKGNLYKTVAQILNVPAPPVPYDLDHLIGKSNQLFLVKTNSPDGKKTYTNVGGILPITAGQVGPKAPADFIRSKDRKKLEVSIDGKRISSPNAQTQQASVAVAEEEIPF